MNKEFSTGPTYNDDNNTYIHKIKNKRIWRYNNNNTYIKSKISSNLFSEQKEIYIFHRYS